MKRFARQGRFEQPMLQSFCGQGRGDVTEILGNKDVTSLFRPRNQIDDSTVMFHVACLLTALVHLDYNGVLVAYVRIRRTRRCVGKMLERC
jgi:hypothetical protein